MKFKPGDVVVRIMDDNIRFINKVLNISERDYVIEEFYIYDKIPKNKEFALPIKTMDRDGRLLTENDKIHLL